MYELLGLAVFFGFALGLGVWTILSGIVAIKEEAEEQDELFSQSPVFRAILPFVQHLGRGLKRFRGLDRMRADLSLKLVRAGKSDAITPDEFMGLMLLCGAAGLGIGLYIRAMIGADPVVVVAIAFLVAFLPLLSIRDAAARRQKAIRKVLPYTLDLLCLSVEAGLDFTAALNRIGDKLGDSPFRTELRVLTRDIAMGKTRAEALRDLDYRVGLEELTSVVSALVQADELGASLGPTLRIQSKELQRKRFQRAEKQAMQAPVLMLFPLVVVIFPLVFLVIFAPMAIKVYTEGLPGVL